MGHNFYQANRLSVQAKRLQTPGESTLGPGEKTPSEQDIGRNDRKSSGLLSNGCSLGKALQWVIRNVLQKSKVIVVKCKLLPINP